MRLTPHGRLLLAPSDDAPELQAALAQRLQQAFARGAGHGLLRLGGAEIGQIVPPVFAYFRDLGIRYVTAVCTSPDVDEQQAGIAPPPEQDLESLASAAPVMPGAEYLTADVLRALWSEIAAALAVELGESGLRVQDFLKKLDPAWNVVGRVHFNLAENRKDERAPFAFLATYTSRLSAHGKAQHLPLGQALREYAGAANKERLLSLLLPVQRAAERCAWLKQMVEAGEIFHPLRWSPARGLSLSRRRARAGARRRRGPHAGDLEAGPPAAPAGDGHRRAARRPSALGKDALLDFRMEVTLDGETLTPAEVKALLAGIERAGAPPRPVGRGEPRTARADDGSIPEQVERLAAEGGLTFAEAMRMLAGADVTRGRSGRSGRPRLVARRRRSVARRDPQGAALARGARQGRSRPRAARHAAALPAGRRPLAPPALRSSASAPASPTTWAWARPSRCSRCCSC